ncbi:hypothetical protein AKJ65_05215 [candidate division MSBL1 archaeon SCGC-AAA259E19]|uniref:Aldehyde ferredoxin oxidoreductase N-terminal domain-containing protein n=1 Tax=candidate division MSBL1 archaeon SCGC-AAA259E19 TaxID=1698264 RepID=A0A133UJ33_9EURY|nr:hypothetical protein AKJ65_05215 [candidate division MSBL1 archaeon SCGC-AAA259E19]
MDGYFGRYLDVDLSDEIIEEYETPEKWIRNYLGGRGTGIRILLEEMDGDEDPLGPNNIMIFATGPLQGTGVPGAGRHVVVSKSPKTESVSDSYAGGFFAHELANSGYDGVILRGMADSPVYLVIDENGPGLEDAEELWGEETADVDGKLKARHDGGRVATIGIAGENLVKFSCIINDKNRAAGRPGFGAVMGSKKLKAVLVKGFENKPIYNEEKLRKTQKEFVENLKESSSIEWGKYGTASGLGALNERGILPTKNFQKGVFDKHEKIEGETLFNEIITERDNCTGCPVRCKRVVRTEFAGEEVEEKYGGPEYETLSAFGSLCMNSDLTSIALANQKCNKYGLDTISTGNTIAFLMEASEKNLLEEDIKWGDSEKIVELVDEIAHREGLGKTVAEGIVEFAEEIEADFAVTSKGQEIPMHDPRGKKGLGISYAISPRGGTHMEGFHDDFREESPEIGVYSLSDRFSWQGKPYATKRFEDFQSFLNSCIFCAFTTNYAGENYNGHLIRRMVNATTGMNIGPGQMLDIGERNFNLLRIHSRREGYTRSNDKLPKRLREALPKGPSSDSPIPKDKMQEAIDEYYKLRGWEAKGPTSDTLRSLGMGEVIESIE